MIEVKAPNSYLSYKGKKSLFLGGSIEMGTAEEWQKKVVAGLGGVDVLIMNPRREEWKPGWGQTIDNPTFREQVEWELQAMEQANIISLYFCPNTKAPITMLNFGLHARVSAEKMIVCCPEGFWRKGYIDIACQRYGLRQVETLSALIQALQDKIQRG